MLNPQRRGLLGLVAALPLAAVAAPPAGNGSLRPFTASQIAEFRARWHGMELSGMRPVLMPGEPLHRIHPGPDTEPSALAPAGWDTLENVR